MGHLDLDRLPRVAAEGPTEAEAAHLRACRECRADVRAAAAAARGFGETLTPPPPKVWDAIAAALADDEVTETADLDSAALDRALSVDFPPAGVAPPGTRARRGKPGPGRLRRAVPAAVAAAVGLLVGSAVTAVVLRGSDEDVAPPVAAATLTGPTATGSARIETEGATRVLTLTAEGLRADSGYYEVWLLDSAGRMYALGVLTPGAQTRLTIPPGLPLAEFGVVDVSRQQFNGDPTHSRDSVLRGTLT